MRQSGAGVLPRLGWQWHTAPAPLSGFAGPPAAGMVVGQQVGLAVV